MCTSKLISASEAGWLAWEADIIGGVKILWTVWETLVIEQWQQDWARCADMRLICTCETWRVTRVACYCRQVLSRSTSSFTRLPYKIIIFFICHQYILITRQTPRCIQRITCRTLRGTDDVKIVCYSGWLWDRNGIGCEGWEGEWWWWVCDGIG